MEKKRTVRLAILLASAPQGGPEREMDLFMSLNTAWRHDQGSAPLENTNHVELHSFLSFTFALSRTAEARIDSIIIHAHLIFFIVNITIIF